LENFHYNEKEMIHFLASMHQESAEVNLQNIWEEAQGIEERKKGLSTLTDLLAQKMGLVK
jgi:hypothetical protein